MLLFFYECCRIYEIKASIISASFQAIKAQIRFWCLYEGICHILYDIRLSRKFSFGYSIKKFLMDSFQASDDTFVVFIALNDFLSPDFSDSGIGST